MRKITIEPLARKTFFDYGNYYNMVEPTGASVGNFYHDKLVFPDKSSWPLTCSCLVVKKPAQYMVREAEYHDTTGECLLPLDDDVVLAVAPASKELAPERIRAFKIPKGTMVELHCGVWHQAPMPLKQDSAHVLILLPQRIYKRDCTVVEYGPEQQAQLVMPAEL